MRVVLLALAFLLPLVPASAAGDDGFLAHFSTTGASSLGGGVALVARNGTIDLGDAVDEPLSLAWDRMTGVLVYKNRTSVRGFTVDGAPEEHAFEIGPGKMVSSACRDPCAFTADFDAVRGATTATFRGANVPALQAVLLERPPENVTPTDRVIVKHNFSALRFDVTGAPASGADRSLVIDGALDADGRLALYLYGVALAIETQDGRASIETGITGSPIAPTPVVPDERKVEAFLTLEGARLVTPAGTRARLVTDALDYEAARLRAEHATGFVEWRGERTPLEDAALSADGAFSGRVWIVNPEWSDAPLADDVAQRGGGAASAVRVDGKALQPASAAAGAPFAPAAVGVGIALALLLVLLKSNVLAPLYSRISTGRVLANPTREALHARVAAHPGEHVAELSRALGVNRVVLQHHLRMLEAHLLVVARQDGRLRRYYPAATAPASVLVELEGALRDPTRRRVALAVLDAAEGETQARLVELLGISQRLVSYHLARLEKAGLVAGTSGRPRVFRATEALRARIAPAREPRHGAGGAAAN